MRSVAALESAINTKDQLQTRECGTKHLQEEALPFWKANEYIDSRFWNSPLLNSRTRTDRLLTTRERL